MSDTTYILHGGNTSITTAENKDFYRKIVELASSENPTILMMYYARPVYRWHESYEDDVYNFTQSNQGKDLNLVLAGDNLDETISQMFDADVIFLAGGKQGFLKKFIIDNWEEFLRAIEGKVVVGISAGANILCRYYYSTIANEIREGTGILNFKVFTHFNDELQEELEYLSDHEEQLEVVTVPEESYTIIKG